MTSSAPVKSSHAEHGNGLRVSVLQGRDQIAAIGGDWDRLAQERPTLVAGSDATNSFAWFETLADTFSRDKALRVVVVERGPEVVGLLPLERVRTTPLGDLLQVPHAWYCGRVCLLAKDDDPEVMRALISGVSAAFARWVSLKLILTQGGAQLRTLQQLMPAQLAAGEEWTSPAFALESTSEAFWKLCSKSTRQLIRTSRNKLSQEAEIRVQLYEDEASAGPLLDTVLEIEHASWKAQAGTAIVNHPEQLAFYTSLFPHLARAGTLLGAVLWVGDQPVAHNFGTWRCGVYCCLKHSHRQDRDKASPAYLLTAELIDTLIARGATHFDFMGVAEPHKWRWSPSTSTYTRQEMVVYRDSLAARAFRSAKQLRGKARALLTRRAAPTETTPHRNPETTP